MSLQSGPEADAPRQVSFDERGGGGCLTLLAIAVWVYAGFHYAVLVGAIDAGSRGTSAVFCLVLTPLGLLLAFGRSSRRVDMTRREIASRFDAIVPWWNETVALDDVRAVTVEVNPHADGIRYDVKLWSADAVIDVPCSGDYVEARRVADTWATQLAVRVRDEKAPFSVSAERLADRLRAAGPTPLPAEPDGWSRRARPSADGWAVALPGFSAGQPLSAVALCAAILGVVTLFADLGSSLPGASARQSLAVVAAIPIIAWVGFRQVARLTQPVLEVNTTTMRVASRASAIALPIGELEDLLLPTAATSAAPDHRQRPSRFRRRPALTAVGARYVFRFGEGLTSAELAFLYALICRTVRGDGTTSACRPSSIVKSAVG